MVFFRDVLGKRRIHSNLPLTAILQPAAMSLRPSQDLANDTPQEQAGPSLLRFG